MPNFGIFKTNTHRQAAHILECEDGDMMTATNRRISSSLLLVFQILWTRKIVFKIRRPPVRYPDVRNKNFFLPFLH